MIFQHADKVLSGEKTQTRRIVKPGDIGLIRQVEGYEIKDGGDHIYQSLPVDVANTATITAVNRNGRRLWYVGQSVAVQPGRGQKSVGRIEITGIRREDVRSISYEDAIAEGFKSRDEFIALWIAMHDKQLNINWPILTDATFKRSLLQGRPAERYQAWVLEFKLVEGA